MSKRFNIRVYGLMINDRQEVLVSDEHRFNRKFTKFPGGGLEWGEGIQETIIREWQEELEIDIKVEELFYVNDFFQPSAFRKEDQILSFYYFVKSLEELKFPIGESPCHPDHEGEAFRWLPIHLINDDSFTFPIDKIVAQLLQSRY